MPILSGQEVTAQQLGWLQPKRYSAAANNTLSLATTTYADVPGCTLNVTTETANAKWDALGIFDMAVATAHATAMMVGRIMVDGVADGTLFAIHAMDDTDRDTVPQSWDGVFPTPGTYTIKLQAALSAAVATGGVVQLYSKLKVTITENV